ncbi:Cupin domain-containing protein [Sanguibacter gelidistatuariae]|uniref:Cupin domain-containing protein n=1 Tax=Sanguibacter gelidistatuariae TaxID=1814289 RepID=A0A1G6GQZ5_9MICO|nr:cupin domain-containing protein [Sanguibacter gelidistatuariae]SDB84368.1 Cupin domain-containing protein [Sanguibacter gelidistatuariae]
MTGAAPIIRKLTDIPGYLISPEDTVRLAELAGPSHGTSTSVFLEIWEPGGAQPLNSHEDSAEIFIVLAGEAEAHSDDDAVNLVAGDVLILAPGSEHRIINTSATDRLYTITIMANDGGFAKLVTDGITAPLTTQDLGYLVRSLAPEADAATDATVAA